MAVLLAADWVVVLVASSLTPEQRKVLSQILGIGRRRGEGPKAIKAAIETGLVESNLTNPSGGDADSEGWRQERASLYPNPTNLSASINRFYNETDAVKGRYGTAGALAAAVQRPAAQYRDRYQQRSGEAQALLGGAGSVGGGPSSKTTTTTTPGVDNSALRRQLIAQFVTSGGPDNPNALTGLAAGLMGAGDKPGTVRKTTTAGPGALSPINPNANVPPQVGQLISRANAINAKHYNYEWGGGHNPGNAPTHGIGHGSGAGVGFDCSGVVSKLFGINPKVASQFEGFGQSGKGRYVTVYANGTHTFLEINGHFFGTSSTNPGGGAGWIPRGAMPASYLKGFVARHPAGM